MNDRMKNLQVIPSVGPSIAQNLWQLGIREVADLKGGNPQSLYEESNRIVGQTQDRCLLYVFRCAVYFASTQDPDPELLQWWKWKDRTI